MSRSRTRLPAAMAFVVAATLVAGAACGSPERTPPDRVVGGHRADGAERAAAVTATEPTGAVPLTHVAAKRKKAKTLLGRQLPARRAVASARPRELGMRFSVTKPGKVTTLRFFKGPGNAGPHRISVWAAGSRLRSAKVRKETAGGWQSVRLATPLDVSPGRTYTVSYLAPHGHWSLGARGFAQARRSGPLRAPRHAGRTGAPKAKPTTKAGAANFFVDVTLEPADGSPPTTLLKLPRIPWEGGPAYWNQFPAAKAWARDTFFPIVLWFNQIDTNQQVAFDKSMGVNTYVGLYEGTDFKLFEDNGVYWIGDGMNPTFDATSKYWVGDFLDDEVDGRFTPAEGRAHLQQLVDERAGDGRFKYANFTQIVISQDYPVADNNAYVNDYTDVVSLDKYWYTIPFCDWRPYRSPYPVPVEQAYCRTASSYGKTMQSLTQRDASDGTLQMRWQFIENLNGGAQGDSLVKYIAPGELKGAVMSSIINEARGIIYFNQSLNGPCQSSKVVRDAQVVPNFCGAPQVQALGQIDGFVTSLAPVINTQSYAYSFGPGLNTMLKTYGDDAYVFAMVDGSSPPGQRTFTLPPDVHGRTVEVVGENRTLPVGADGTFTDAFAAEYSFHVYRIPLS